MVCCIIYYPQCIIQVQSTKLEFTYTHSHTSAHKRAHVLADWAIALQHFLEIFFCIRSKNFVYLFALIC